MDGLLVIDKPAGPTSHDVVARMLRVLGERRIGHTGTLDPAATGVLALVLGRATRLARFMSAATKSYDAVVRLGVRTDTDDAEGVPSGKAYDGPWPSMEAVENALVEFRGSYLQQPPAFSAKKIDGVRSYALARTSAADGDGAAAGKRPASCPVTAERLEIVALDGPVLEIRLDCSAGFYVRALARDLGERLGTGAHLARLRRTRAGEFDLSHAIPLETAERDRDEAAGRVMPLRRLLAGLASITLTPDAVRRAQHGRDLGPGDVAGRFSVGPVVRLLDPGGDLVGVAEPARAPGLLHPSVILM